MPDMIRVELTAMDSRICPLCAGAGWYYVETPGRNKPLYARLVKCQRSMYHLNYIDLPAPRTAPAFAEEPS